DDIRRITKSARRRALHAVADLEQQLSRFVVDQNTVKMRVGNQEPAQAIDRQAARSIDVELGSPPAAEKGTLAIENLDPVSKVGEIQMILPIKCGNPRLV